MKTYTIRNGASFRMADGSLLTGGQTIELEDDVAALWPDRLEPAPDADPQTPATQTGDA